MSDEQPVTEGRPFASSESIDQLVVALAEAHKTLAPIEKSKTANVPTKAGGSYSYDYADLAAILKVTRPKLAEVGLVVVQTPSVPARGAVAIRTTLLHTSGQWMSDVLTVPVTDSGDAQKLGSAISYGRRYAYCGAVGVAPEDEDDDGAAAREAGRGAAAGRGTTKRAGAAARAPQRPARAAEGAAHVTREDAEGDVHPDDLPISSVNGDGTPGGQVGRLKALLKEHKVPAKDFGAYLLDTYHYASPGEIQQRHYEEIVQLAQNWSGPDRQ